MFSYVQSGADTATRLRAGQSRIRNPAEVRNVSLVQNFQDQPQGQPASGTVVLSRGVKLTDHLHPSTRSRMVGTVSLLPKYCFMACTGSLSSEISLTLLHFDLPHKFRLPQQLTKTYAVTFQITTNKMQRCLIYLFLQTLYMFQTVSPPITRSTNCTYSFRYCQLILLHPAIVDEMIIHDST